MKSVDTSTLIAILGALTGLVGTFSGALIAYISLKHTLDGDRHRVVVKLSKSILINTPGVSTDDTQFVIYVANLGNVPFTVGNIGIQVGHHSGGLAIPTPTGTHQLGTTLERDKTCNFWSKYDEAVKSMKKMANRSNIKARAYVSDYAGNRFNSKWVEIRFNETWYSKTKAKAAKWQRVALQAIWP